MKIPVIYKWGLTYQSACLSDDMFRLLFCRLRYKKKKIPISLFLLRFQIKTPIAFLLPRTTFDRPKKLVQDKVNKIHDSNKSELKLVSTSCIHK